MKRTALMLLVVAAISVPFGALAGDIRTPEECAAGATADDPTLFFQQGDAPGRGSFCLSDGDAGNGNELYVGGDATAPCGHIEILGEPVEDGSGQGEAFCHD